MTPAELKEMRIKLGLSQKKMAAKIGIATLTWHHWENGHAIPSALSLYKLKNAIGENDDRAVR